MARFDDCLNLILNFEGGYSDDPSDPGGATNLGIIQTEYDSYRKSIGATQQSVRNITHDEAATIYQDNYWAPTHAEYLTQPLDVVMFDTSVNNGTGTAIKWLQIALGAPVTRVFDSATSEIYHAYIDAHGVDALAEAVLRERVVRYHQLGDSGRLNKFLRGWLNRVSALEKWAGLPVTV